jgi:diacylglycerol diphosphate phosphatase/phosphatidate phosphatase
MPIVLAGNTLKKFTQEDEFYDYPPRTQYSLKSIVASYLTDYMTLLVLAGLGVTFTLIKHPEEMFRFDDFNLAYPDVTHNIPAWMSAIFSVAVPIVLLIAAQLFIRNFHDFHHSFLGLAFSMLINLTFTGFLWIMIGGNRPDFLQSCKPDLSKIVPDKVYYYPSEICKDHFWDKLLFTPGFPSGHASNAFSAWMFIALYLNAKVRPFDNRSHMWKFVITWIGPLFMPIWISSSRLVDHTHTWLQVAVGISIGVPCAFIGYRYMYCSLFGVDSHVPTFYLWRRKKTELEEARPINIASAADSWSN